MFHANAALQSAVTDMSICLPLLHDEHKVGQGPTSVEPLLERQRLVNNDLWDAQEMKHR